MGLRITEVFPVDNPYESSETALVSNSNEERMPPKQRFAWSRFLLILLLGIPLSTLAVWFHALSEQGVYGGRTVSMSNFGNGFFAVMGGALGLVSGLFVGVIYLTIADSQGLSACCRTWTVPMLAGVFVSVIAFIGYLFLMMTIFFAMPDDLFRMIFDVPNDM